MASFRDMQDRVIDATGRQPNSDRGEVAKLINDVYLEVVERARINMKTVAKTLTAGVGDYSIANDFGLTDLVAIRSITSTIADDTLAVPVEPVTFDEILWQRRTTSTATGTLRVFALLGADQFSLWPTPSGTDTITIYYQYRPLLMTQDADTPNAIPPEFHYVIEDGAISRSARSAGWKNPQSQNQASAFQARYDQGVYKLLKWRNQRQAALPRRVVVGMHRRASHNRNDVYYSGDN